MTTTYQIEFGDPESGEIESVYTPSMRAAQKITDACSLADWPVNLVIHNDELYNMLTKDDPQ